MSTERSNSTLTRLREMILRGRLQPGERLLEVDVAAALGVSRTPVRNALPALAQEGLLVRVGARGYRVRAFTRAESLQAVHLRALLEGHAARAIVIAGGGVDMARTLAPILHQGDAVLAADPVSEAVEEAYGQVNALFHEAVIARAANPLLADMIARCNIIPFAAPAAVAFGRKEDARIARLLRQAQREHHVIATAFHGNDALRVEMLFREHAVTQEHCMLLDERDETAWG
ncbi:MAG TPA: GntR family transcriptional regulator [Sphingomonas sp.]|nr:GntR family transcriptional regulator [Sphingomonas sp.]